jgi:hypothetical protein
MGQIQIKGWSTMKLMSQLTSWLVHRLVTGVVPRSLALILVASLCACGGITSDSPVTPAPVGQPMVPPPAASVLAGAASGTLYQKNFVTFMTADLAPDINWYAMYFFSTSSEDIIPILYSGSVNLAPSGTSSAGLIREFGAAAISRPASGSWSETSLGSYRVIISGVNAPNNRPIELSSSASATLADASGRWDGVWTDNLNASVNKPAVLQFDQGLAATVTFGGCVRHLRLVRAVAANSPYFSVSADIPSQTGCPRTPGTDAASLNGVAFVLPSLFEGKTRRLMLMLVDRTGSGFSFAGDQ